MSMLTYERTIHVYETDLMGIVHHSNYLRFSEEARVAWCKKHLSFLQQNVYDLVVVETKVKHKLPLKYGDTVKIDVQTEISGALFKFQYRISNQIGICALVETTHCSVNKDLKPKRLDDNYINAVKKDNSWTATWL
jgi:acyl-CoA thioester hydrolase